MTPIQLSDQTLRDLPGSVARPTYDRRRLKTGIVHVGVGGFHRSHQAFYTDRLLQSGGSTEWGISGVGLREADREIAEALRSQDYLYTLLVKHPDGAVEAQVIGSIVDFLLGPDDPNAVIERMAAPETRIVSLTITEGGYNVDPATGEFDSSRADVQHDLAHPDQPRLIFGYLTAALKRRRDRGLPAFTVQSCDNIQHNGDLTRRMLLSFARLQDAALADWIQREVRFPNAMVDRITPATTDDDRKLLTESFGVVDRWPVPCEPFHQWVIEDQFASGRPDWEQVGAQFVPEVSPYETMKLRQLNAGHSVLGIPGALAGLRTIDECISDETFESFLRAFLNSEAVPTLDPVAGIDLLEYQNTLVERFGNPHIRDSVDRICLGSSDKLPVFLLPTIRDNLASGGRIELATFVTATWCRYCDQQTDVTGRPLAIQDDLADELHLAAKETEDDPLAFLRVPSVFGDLVDKARFCETYAEMVTMVYQSEDMRRLMKDLLSNGV